MTNTIWCWFGDERKRIPCHYVLNEPNYQPSKLYGKYRREPLPMTGYTFKESIEGWHAVFVGEHDH